MPVGEGPGAMTVDRIFEQARDTLTVKRVFGDPYEAGGCLVVPVASVRGGGGGGGGTDTSGNGGSGGGFGTSARPVGVYRIKGDEVTWLPAVDSTRIAVLGEVVAIVALLVLRSLFRRSSRR
jgi:uncharacterized spore protein YtfJ